MVCPGDELELTDRLVKFSVKYSLNSPMQGTVWFANPNCTLESSCIPCSPIRASLGDISATSCGDCVDEDMETCFESDPNWLEGLVISYQEAGFIDDVPIISGQVVAFSDYLNTKPINTELFSHDDLYTALSDISLFYAGIPAAYIDINIPVATYDFQGPVQGNSTWSELQKLAQAGNAHIFTQVGGVLTIDPWKDDTASVDYNLPKEFIISSEKAPVANNMVSAIRARGASVPKYDCGEQIFTSNSLDGEPTYAGYLTSCAYSGVPTPEIGVSFDNLAANREDIRNAQIAADGVQASEIKEAKDGSFRSSLSTDSGAWFDSSGLNYSILVYGNRRPSYEGQWGDAVNPNIMDTFNQWSAEFHSMFVSRAIWPFPASTFQTTGLWGGSSNASGTYFSDQPSLEQLEMYVLDTDFTACGLKVEQLDNPYVPSKERLFSLAVRRFQEMKMQADSWLIEVPYLPCLRLNDVVTFQPTMSEGCHEIEVTGVIAGIQVDYDASKPEARMKLVIWGFDCIGSTAYTSSNLISVPCAGYEAASTTGWETSLTNLDTQAYVDDFCGVVYTAGTPSVAYLYYTHEEMVPGVDYTISFDYELLEGVGNLIFTDPGGPTSVSGSGTVSSTFTAGVTNFQFQWILQNTIVPTAYRICDIRLTKTITA